MSARARLYQEQRTGLPASTVYRVKGVAFDGYRNRTLIEAKGEGYAWAGQNGVFRAEFRGAQAMLDQARREVAVAGTHPVQREVAEQSVATALQDLFARNGIQRARVPLRVSAPELPSDR